MKKSFLIILIIIILLLAGVIAYFVYATEQKNNAMEEVMEMMNFEKEQAEREFQNAVTEFDGYNANTIHNDSLFKLLDDQKQKISQLLEELRITKATNAKRISELKAELVTVRKVMVHYITQIDSLNVENKELKAENNEVKRRYQEAAHTAEQLAKEKDDLTEVVTRASKLEVVACEVVRLNNRGKKTSLITQIANLEFAFVLHKNITADTGVKTVYLRITCPDGAVLTKSPHSLLNFEDKRIAYSAKKEIEYAGEEMSDKIYWEVAESVQKGNYKADFFIDGNLAGTFNFVLRKY